MFATSGTADNPPMARVVTVGGSIGGLATALVLSGRGHHVTVLERDPDPVPLGPEEAWRAWPRRGVAHLRGTHMFNARGLGILADHLPEVLAELRAAGAREAPVPGSAPGGGSAFNRLLCRRTTYEMALRTVALRRPSIRFETGTTAVELLPGARARPGIPHVAGAQAGDGRTFPADLVVDASGRNSGVAGWLSALGRLSAAGLEAEVRPAGDGVRVAPWTRSTAQAGPSSSGRKPRPAAPFLVSL